MLKRLSLPPAALLRQHYTYDPTTGALWSNRRKRSHPLKKTNTSGYIQVEIAGSTYCAHKLIFKMMTGRDPIGDLDHRNGIGSDNRWRNLREATPSQNQGNAKRRRDSSGMKGTSYIPRLGKWAASITHQGTRNWLGCYATQAEAHAAYCRAANSLFGEFARHR